MEIRAAKPYAVVIGLMALTSLLLAFTVEVGGTDEAGVLVALPDRVGEWTGDEILFCQAVACQETVLASELHGEKVCPKCGGKLSGMSKAEADLLPPDTEILKKRYQHPDGSILTASIVMSGRERASIHRPQVCLVGQGNEIVKERVVDVPLQDRGPLQVMLLDLLHRRHGTEGQEVSFGSYYAYWFVGKGRETPHHWQRMWWMASDRILHNVAHRWAYIAVAGQRDIKSEAYREQMKNFVSLLYPQMRIH